MQSSEESQPLRVERPILRYPSPGEFLHPDEEESIQRIINDSYKLPRATAEIIERTEWGKEGF